MDQNECIEQDLIPEIELQDIYASNSGFSILKGISVNFPKNKTTIIMGNAGSGKSSLLKIAAALVVPDSGNLLWNKLDLLRLTSSEEMEFRKKTGFAFQDAALWANQSIQNNLSLPLRLHKKELKSAQILDIVKNTAELFGYTESLSIRPAELSTGEQKLIGIARAFILDPDFVFMDEPTASIDDTACEKLYRLILNFKNQKKGMAIVTHSTELAQLVADSIIIIKDGKLIVQGDYNTIASTEDNHLRAIVGRLKPRVKEC